MAMEEGLAERRHFSPADLPVQKASEIAHAAFWIQALHLPVVPVTNAHLPAAEILLIEDWRLMIPRMPLCMGCRRHCTTSQHMKDEGLKLTHHSVYSPPSTEAMTWYLSS